jgi:methylmalonyl-CoA mutase
LHTNAFDEAIALPSDFAARIARNTQLIIEHEAGVVRTVDPFGGSYFMESLTHALAQKAQSIIDEVEALGGMTRAVESGMPKLRIEEAAAKRQARVDRGLDVIVGVNKYQVSESEPVDVRVVDNTLVRNSQIARLEKIRATRDARAVEQALAALTQAAEAGSGNLLELSIQAARARATVGEISLALEKVFGRHQAETKSIAGVYGSFYSDDPGWTDLKAKIAAFAEEHGRRPRILVVKLGQDGHDRGAKIIATAFADLGFDVDVGPLFQTPEEAARQAVENDVHVVGVSTQAAGHTTLVPALIAELQKLDASDIGVICGGVIPASDYEALYQVGVGAVFGPGTPIVGAAKRVLELISEGSRNSSASRSDAAVSA